MVWKTYWLPCQILEFIKSSHCISCSMWFETLIRKILKVIADIEKFPN
jgi:hypothetical protein